MRKQKGYCLTLVFSITFVLTCKYTLMHIKPSIQSNQMKLRCSCSLTAWEFVRFLGIFCGSSRGKGLCGSMQPPTWPVSALTLFPVSATRKVFWVLCVKAASISLTLQFDSSTWFRHKPEGFMEPYWFHYKQSLDSFSEMAADK